MADHKRLFAVAKKALACFVHGVMRGFGADLLDDGMHARQAAFHAACGIAAHVASRHQVPVNITGVDQIDRAGACVCRPCERQEHADEHGPKARALWG